MPYNVICLTCTVVALAFGPLNNITTKSLTLIEATEAPPGLLTRIKNFFKKFVKRENDSQNQDETKEETTETESKKDKWKVYDDFVITFAYTDRVNIMNPKYFIRDAVIRTIKTVWNKN